MRNQEVMKKFIVLTAIVFAVFCNLASAAERFSLDQVKLLDGPFRHAQDLNLEVLLKYDVDRLFAGFRKEAGLEPKGKIYPNWEGLDGHVGGHYLSAMAMYAASTGNQECRRRMEYILDELEECQAANGNGYIGAVPNGKAIWQQIANGNPRAISQGWVPWYNVHKTFAGLRDAWIYCKSERARDMFIKYCDWCCELLKNYTPQQMEQMIDTEYGGMNEVLADAYTITGDKKYFDLACAFSHRRILTPLSQGIDNLDNMHANTQVPKVVGFSRIAMLGGEKMYGDAAKFFWQTVVNNRSLSFGGNSRREHFPAQSAAFEMIEEREGPESCNTYNMLKLTMDLFDITHEAKYSDYYERALYNHILSTQHPDHGGYVYFTPARPRHYRVYSAPNEGMWCCVGSGMENHAKYGEFIYSHSKDDEVFVNLFIASILDWKDNDVQITQNCKYPENPETTLVVNCIQPKEFTLSIRHPAWAKDGYKIMVNGQVVASDSKPGSYASIKRKWSNNDKIEVKMPMTFSVESAPYVDNHVSVLYGPVLLAAKTGNENLTGLVADDSRWGHIAHGRLMPLDSAPMLVANKNDIPHKIKPASDNKPLHFNAGDIILPATFKNLTLEPFYQVHDARYIMYWNLTSPEAYNKIVEEMKAQEEMLLKLDQSTLDRVIPGEQQPEADHFMKQSGSEAGNYQNKSYRHALHPGWFSYQLKVDPEKSLKLFVTYWGNEQNQRTFDILIDDQKLATENTSRKWSKEEFVNVTYSIPASMVKDKKVVTVTFKPQSGSYAGGIYDLRIISE